MAKISISVSAIRTPEINSIDDVVIVITESSSLVFRDVPEISFVENIYKNENLFDTI